MDQEPKTIKIFNTSPLVWSRNHVNWSRSKTHTSEEAYVPCPSQPPITNLAFPYIVHLIFAHCCGMAIATIRLLPLNVVGTPLLCHCVEYVQLVVVLLWIISTENVNVTLVKYSGVVLNGGTLGVELDHSHLVHRLRLLGVGSLTISFHIDVHII